MTGITADVRFAMRALWRHRGFTIAVVLTLAVGVGVTSAVFSVYRAALLRPLAVAEPDRLVFLHRFETRRGYYSSASYPAFIDYRERAADFVDFAAYTTGSVSVEHRGTRRLPAAMVSADYFHIAGVSPLLGRGFGAADGAHVAMISEKLWLDSFDRDESVSAELSPSRTSGDDRRCSPGIVQRLRSRDPGGRVGAARNGGDL